MQRSGAQEDFATSSLQEILNQQLLAVQTVVAANQALAQRLANLQDHGSSSSSPSNNSPPIAIPQVKVVPAPTSSAPSLPEFPVAPPTVAQRITHRTTSFLSRFARFTKERPPAVEPLLGEGRSAGDHAHSDVPMSSGALHHHFYDWMPSSKDPSVHEGSVNGEGGDWMTRKRSLFPDIDEMKETLLEPEYNVEDLYKNEGCCQAIAKSGCFKNSTFIVILVNALWIGVDTDWNDSTTIAQALPVFQIAENVFCTFFTFELLVRFGSFREKWAAFRDAWFLFDLVLVALMIWETWVSVMIITYMEVSGSPLPQSGAFRIFRLLRLTRVSRLAKLLRGMPELLVLIKGMGIAMRSIVATLCLLCLIIYVFAIIFTQLLSKSDIGDGCFQGVLKSANCLLLQGAFPDQADMIMEMLDASWVYYFLILLYYLLASLTVMNMLIGVVCEVIGGVAELEKEEVQVAEVKRKVLGFIGKIDSDGDCAISQVEFGELLRNAEAARVLHELGVDVFALVESKDMIFYNQEELSFSDFIKMLLQFRETNQATVKDVVDVRRIVLQELALIKRKLGVEDGYSPMAS